MNLVFGTIRKYFYRLSHRFMCFWMFVEESHVDRDKQEVGQRSEPGVPRQCSMCHQAQC